MIFTYAQQGRTKKDAHTHKSNNRLKEGWRVVLVVLPVENEGVIKNKVPPILVWQYSSIVMMMVVSLLSLQLDLSRILVMDDW